MEQLINKLTEQINEPIAKYEQLLNKFNDITNANNEYKIKINESNKSVKQMEI